MVKYKNEDGAVLVLCLMIITLFLVFMLIMFTQTINTSRQVKAMESEIDAQMTAQMGVDYFQHWISTLHNDYESMITGEKPGILPIIRFFEKIRSGVRNAPYKEFEGRAFEMSDFDISLETAYTEIVIDYQVMGYTEGAEAAANGKVIIPLPDWRDLLHD
ncbi:hypothetical protein [Oceanobacillus massiliensis]|uniref:hypothetical protein n=1 Tax=Oceanobacillus massiliensis TaxID=1465765 RepID=UPI000289B64F|nr:hypothetical protein [Oceanobacillus massiliensis]